MVQLSPRSGSTAARLAPQTLCIGVARHSELQVRRHLRPVVVRGPRCAGSARSATPARSSTESPAVAARTIEPRAGDTSDPHRQRQIRPALRRAWRGKLRRRGAWVATAPLAAIAFDTERPAGLAIPGFDGGLPDAVLVRSIAAGSFEAVTRRLGVLHALARLSVPVWNSAQAIERCVDKSMTTFLLKNAGLPTPPTFAVEGRAAAAEIARAANLPRTPLVLKPLFGAQGPRHQDDPRAVRPARPGRGERRLLSAALRAARRASLPRFPHLRLRRQAPWR